MKKNTFKVMFVIRRNQVNRDGKCSIVIRITVNGEYERLNSTLSIEPELWDSKAAKALGRTQKILDFNKRIDEIRYVSIIVQIFMRLIRSFGPEGLLRRSDGGVRSCRTRCSRLSPDAAPRQSRSD